ncbi:hypothetical protein DRE_02180 [Drechslerella stenobrocha 248]|uniref:Microbial-type PARG catalytic domain-containing protein n=1 Tax=Drechslerella stenobrocha 248 TaxID=1043628 RepID=W7HW64_9PEZI|nr:hypothetical protein DRE_02180 [Drechslerella stenobrocha 248]
MPDGKIPEGERYVQLNLIDMFGRRGGSSNTNNRDSRRESSDSSQSSRRGASESRGGPIRSQHSSSPRRSGSDSAFRGSRHRDQGADRERHKGGYRDRRGGGYDGRRGERGRGGYSGRGHRLGGDETQDSSEASSSREDGDVEMGDGPAFYQGTSSMLRAAGGGSSSLSALNRIHAPMIVKECRTISKAVFSQDTDGYLYNALDIKPLGASYCPRYRVPADGEGDTGSFGCRIQVVNRDTFACAIDMVKRHNFEQSQIAIATAEGNIEPSMHPVDTGVVVLNMANAQHKGGGFLNGSVAQEEALMHRSTLWHTLSRSLYPMTDTEAIYSPHVAIYKEYDPTASLVHKGGTTVGSYVNAERADAILKSPTPLKNANTLPLPGPPLVEVAVISIAAIQGPALKEENPLEYEKKIDQDLMEVKIRQMLRMAGLNGHRRVVLGAFGCGAFANPKETVAKMFLSVLQEPEFQGGWWKEMVFGCYDPPGSKAGNFPVFHKLLDGQIVPSFWS